MCLCSNTLQFDSVTLFVKLTCAYERHTLSSTHIVLPGQLVAQIDIVVGKRGRSSFLVQATEKELLRARQLNALKQLGLRNKVKLEASGGINAYNIKSYAKSGVDMISVGKLTSSVSGLDLSLEIS